MGSPMGLPMGLFPRFGVQSTRGSPKMPLQSTHGSWLPTDGVVEMGGNHLGNSQDHSGWAYR